MNYTKMADEDITMTSDNVNDVTNHMDAGNKAGSHENDRSAEIGGNDAQFDGKEEKTDGSDEEDVYESCADDKLPSEIAAEETNRGNRDDEIVTVANSPDGGKTEDELAQSTSEGGSKEDETAMEEDKKPSQGGDAHNGTASEKTDKSEGGGTEEGMASEDANHGDATALKLLDTLEAQPHKGKSRRARRSYRRRNQESGVGDDDKSDSSDDDGERHETDSSTRSQRSHSDSSATESDMEGEGKAEPDGEGDRGSKASTAEFCSDLEDELLAKLLPKPSWRALPMLRSRELGLPKEQGSFCSRSIGSVHLVSRFEKYCELKHHGGCVNTLHFNQSGRLLASGSDDLNIVLWDWARQKTTLVYPSGHKSNVFQAKFMPFSGDTTIVSCARDGQVRVAELSSTGICKGTKKLVQHKGSAHKLGLEPDSPVVFLTCGEDAAVFNIDLRTSKATKLVTVKEDVRKVALYTIFLNPMNTNEYCVGGRDHFVRIYDRRKVSDEREGLVKKFCPHHLLNSETRANVTCSVYSYNGREILASYNDEDIYLFDSTHSDGAEFIRSYKGHRNNQTVKGVNFYGPQSQFVVSGSDCGNIFLWEKNTEKIVQYMKGDNQGVVNCLESHPTNAVLATSGLDHDVKIWMPTAAEPSRLEGLKRTMYSNRREREEERSREPEIIDGHMLMFLMHHLRRRARRQAREAGDLDSNSSSSDSDTSEDEDGEGDVPSDRSQCVPS